MAGTEVVGLAPETSAARLVFAQLLVQGQAVGERYQKSSLWKFAALFLLPGAQAGQAGRVGGWRAGTEQPAALGPGSVVHTPESLHQVCGLAVGILRCRTEGEQGPERGPTRRPVRTRLEQKRTQLCLTPQKTAGMPWVCLGTEVTVVRIQPQPTNGS